MRRRGRDHKTYEAWRKAEASEDFYCPQAHQILDDWGNHIAILKEMCGIELEIIDDDEAEELS